MRSAAIVTASLLALAPHVSAHGYVRSVAIDGTTYQGNPPMAAPFDSPIRQISTVDPVKGVTNPLLACGQDAKNAALVVPANAGSQVTFAWASGGGGNWIHDTGPIMTYMAECTGTTCDKFDASGAQWFKIDEAGKKPDGSAWVQKDLQSGKPYTLTIPQGIEPGDYLIRHEIIALQIAVSVGGAEFYPSCTQVRIGGNGDKVPNATVSFPGAYTETEPGILTPDVYNPGFVYTFPGPPIASFVDAVGAAGSNNGAGPNVTTPNAPSQTYSTSSTSYPAPSASSTSPTSTAASGGCDMPADGGYYAREYHPRRFSRVMRTLKH